MRFVGLRIPCLSVSLLIAWCACAASRQADGSQPKTSPLTEYQKKSPEVSRPSGPFKRKRARRLLLIVDIHPVERVPPERAELEVDDFLAHRLQLHRMRDREPGCLL